jgi:hypothetical protein
MPGRKKPRILVANAVHAQPLACADASAAFLIPTACSRAAIVFLP